MKIRYVGAGGQSSLFLDLTKLGMGLIVYQDSNFEVLNPANLYVSVLTIFNMKNKKAKQ